MTTYQVLRKYALLAVSLFAAAQTLTAQTWTQTGAVSNYWYCIAASADGSRLIAGTWPGFVYLSTNSGTTWTPTIASTDQWSSVASSADGTKLMAVSANNGIFISINSGATWAATNWPYSYWWGSSASSADGKILAATAIPNSPDFSLGVIFCSTNFGTSWTSNHISGITGVAMSADGTKMVAAASPYLWRSTNSGTTWMLAAGAPVIYYPVVSPSQYVASSADGNKLVYCIPPGTSGSGSGSIYVSADAGDTWTLTSAPGEPWLAVASSADGNTLMAAPNTFDDDPYPIFLSTNSGATWTTNNSPNQIWGDGLASSADGGKLFAAAGFYDSEPIYISQSVRSPSLHITPKNGNVKLSWFVPSTNFVLQQSANLSSWTDMTNTPTPSTDNLNSEVTLPGTNNIGFYRLKTP